MNWSDKIIRPNVRMGLLGETHLDVSISISNIVWILSAIERLISRKLYYGWGGFSGLSQAGQVVWARFHQDVRATREIAHHTTPKGEAT